MIDNPPYPLVFSRGSGGLVVSILSFYFNDPSLNPAGYFNCLYKKIKINEKEAGVGPSLNKSIIHSVKHELILNSMNCKFIPGNKRTPGRYFVGKNFCDISLVLVFSCFLYLVIYSNFLEEQSQNYQLRRYGRILLQGFHPK